MARVPVFVVVSGPPGSGKSTTATVLARELQARAVDRHAGHFDAARSIDDLYHDDVAQPVAGGWPVVEVDTNRPVSSDALLATVNALLR